MLTLQLLAITEDKHCMIVGDFNFPGIDRQGSTERKHARDYFDIVRDYFLYKQVDTTT